MITGQTPCATTGPGHLVRADMPFRFCRRQYYLVSTLNTVTHRTRARFGHLYLHSEETG